MRSGGAVAVVATTGVAGAAALGHPPDAMGRRIRPSGCEPLDEQFLRRSKRNIDKLGGFKDLGSAKKAALEPKPLAIIPAGSNAPAPHLTHP